MPNSNGSWSLSDKSNITIGMAITFVIASMWLFSRLSSIDSNLALMSRDITDIRGEIQFATQDRYRKEDAEKTFLELQRLNPTLRVPNPGNGNEPFFRSDG